MYMSYVKMCMQCVKKPEDDFQNGYYPFIGDDISICPICHCELIDTILTIDEYLTIEKISSEHSFIEAMVKLKESNPIDYQLKLNQFILQQEQHKAIEEQQRKDNKPHCPYCNSTDVKKISGISKAGSVAIWGIFAAGKVSKNYHCNKCKSDF